MPLGVVVAEALGDLAHADDGPVVEGPAPLLAHHASLLAALRAKSLGLLRRIDLHSEVVGGAVAETDHDPDRARLLVRRDGDKLPHGVLPQVLEDHRRDAPRGDLLPLAAGAVT
jgi:hypothetical protein